MGSESKFASGLGGIIILIVSPLFITLLVILRAKISIFNRRKEVTDLFVRFSLNKIY